MTPLTNSSLTPPGAEAERDGAPAAERRWAVVVLVWLALAVLLVLVQLRRQTPTVFLDELVLGRVAENIGRGAGETFQGLPSNTPSIYPYVVAPAWALLDGAAAYRLALGINALLMTSVVLPAYGLAALVAPHRRALFAAACAALVPAMVWAGMLMTEAVAYPLTAWTLWAMVAALRRPTLARTALVGVLIVAAYLVRAQLIALGGVFVLAVALEVLRGGRAELALRARRHRVVLAAACAGGAGLGALLLFSPRSLGNYGCAVAGAPSPGELAGPLVDYVGTMFVATLGLPPIALAALAARRANWRSEPLAPLLCVGIATVATLLVVAAWTAVTVSPELQERYVFYPAPVLLALLCALPGRASARAVALVAIAATAYAVALFPGFADVTGEVVVDRLGLPGVAGDVLGSRAVLWGGLFAALGLAAVLAVRVGGARGALVALGAAALFGAATLGVRQVDANLTSGEFRAALPAPLDVVDRMAGEEPAGIVVAEGSPGAVLFGVQMWNEQADRVFRLGIPDAYGAGQLCPVRVARDGTMEALIPCAGRDLPRWLVFVDGVERLRFATGDVRYDDRGVRLVEYADGEPRRLALASPADAARLSASLTPPRDPDEPLRRCNEQ